MIDRKTIIIKSNFFIYNASAGSGKTYRLIINFLKLLLKDDNLENVRHILAITFTNKATFEMKDRLLEWLENYANEDKYKTIDSLLTISKELDIPIDILHIRSQRLLKFIIHHYSLLSISTIDKFNLRLIRSFSKELNVAKNFSIEINPDEYITEAIEMLQDQMGLNNPYAQLLLDYYLWSFEQEYSSFSFISRLKKQTKDFLNEQHTPYFSEILKLDYIDFRHLKETIHKRIKNNEEKLLSESQQILNLIFETDIKLEDFYQSGKGVGFLIKNISEGRFNKLNSYHENFLYKHQYTSSKNISAHHKIKSIYPEIASFLEDYIKIFKIITVDKQLIKDIIILELHSEIQKNLNQIKEENNLIFISDFNQIIHQHLANQPAAFIYEKIGSKYRHYFFDEFQDTSQLQWDNFNPLIENVVSSPENQSITIMGDPKQSIYRFRSGKPEIMLELMDNPLHTVQNLETNYRSLKNIVDFNNAYYNFISQSIPDIHYKELFGNSAQQKSFHQENGKVQVSLIDEGRFQEQALNRIKDIITELQNNGFQLNDICILVRKNKEINIIGEYLKTYNIDVLSPDALLIGNSAAIKSLIYFLKALYLEEDKQLWVNGLYWWLKCKEQLADDFNDMVQPYYSLDYKEIKHSIEDMLEIVFPEWGNELSLYDYMETFIRDIGFGEKEKAWTISFLNMVYEFENTFSKNIIDFLNYWETDGYKKGILSQDNNAIHILTVHKSKGLEFPVVIIPNLSSREEPQKNWIPLSPENYKPLPHFYSSIQSLLHMDEEIDKAFAHYEFEKYIDKLCYDYVATTRAEQHLYIIKKKNPKKNNDYLLQYLTSKGFDTNADIIDLYEVQDIKKIEKNQKDKPIKTISIDWISNKWEEKLYFAVPEEVQENKEFGILMHEILSQIIYENDIGKVLNDFVTKGKIAESERDKYFNSLKNIISSPEVNFLYQNDCTVYNERDVFMGQKIFRPDRWVVKNGLNYLIDYKTGEAKTSNKDQIRTYKHYFQQLNKPIEKTFLIYISNDSYIEID